MKYLKTQEISSKNLIQSLPGDPVLTVALIVSLSYRMGTGDKAVLSHRLVCCFSCCSDKMNNTATNLPARPDLVKH